MMGLHESQSRFYENILGRNPNFWIPVYDKLEEFLPDFRKIPFDTFCKAINFVQPSMIRIDADEVTYCLHIILRYEIERAIFNDEVTTEELPELWNDKMEELLESVLPVMQKAYFRTHTGPMVLLAIFHLIFWVLYMTACSWKLLKKILEA